MDRKHASCRSTHSHILPIDLKRLRTRAICYSYVRSSLSFLMAQLCRFQASPVYAVVLCHKSAPLNRCIKIWSPRRQHSTPGNRRSTRPPTSVYPSEAPNLYLAKAVNNIPKAVNPKATYRFLVVCNSYVTARNLVKEFGDSHPQVLLSVEHG